MRAITIEPRKAHSVRLEEIRESPPSEGALLVDGIAIGVCGTDRELIAGSYGWAPPGEERLVIGHESLGRVREAPTGSGFAPGDLVVGIVRRPDPVPCSSCAVGEWDMCRNGRYTERGIKELAGYGSERFRLEPEFAVKIDPALGWHGVLLEPASVVAKAWDHVDRIGHRAAWRPRTALVTGAGPVGLLAALMGTQRGLQIHVLDRATSGPKPKLVRDLGATYHVGSLRDLGLAPDIVIECTGVASVIVDAMNCTAPGGVTCLAGVSSGGHRVPLDIGLLNRELVLENDVVFGSVNANRTHYAAAAEALARADRTWLEGLLTRRVPLDRWEEAYEPREHDVKTIVELGAVP